MKNILCHNAHAGSRNKFRNTLWEWMLAIVALTVTASGTASALTINLTYDPDATFTAAGLSAADIVNMKAANAYAAKQFTNRYSDNVNVNIKVTAVPGTSTLGESSTSLIGINSYASLRGGIVADSTTADDATSLGAGGSLPAADPIGGAHLYLVSRAQGKAFGFLGDDLVNDGTYTFGGGFSYTYDPLNRAVAGKIDYIGVSMHEFSEIMGRIGLMGQNLTGDPDYMMFDLLHYTGAGVRGLNNGPGRFFSIDNGTTLLKAFNDANANGGDLQDWASGTNDTFNAFSSDSVKNDLTLVDIRNMDVIGYNFVGLKLSEASSRKTHGGAGTFDLNLPLTGTPGAEGRSGSGVGSGDHTIALTFTTPVTAGTAGVTSGMGMVSGVSFSGYEMLVNLTGVTNGLYVTVTANGVTDVNGSMLGATPVTAGFLLGDVIDSGASRVVNASDVSQTKVLAGAILTGANFRADVSVNGVINASDVSSVKLNSGTGLP